MSGEQAVAAAADEAAEQSPWIPFSDVLDSLAEEICVVDMQGRICYCNAAWLEAVQKSEDPGLLRAGLGENYLELVEREMLSPVHEIAAAAQQVHTGLIAVLSEGQSSYECDYFCDAPLNPQYFHLRLQRIGTSDFVTVAHYNRTTEHIAEMTARAMTSKCNELLWCFLPRTIADQLQREPNSLIANSHECATIIFCDLVNFTPLASTLRPLQVVTILNELFSVFDELAEVNGMEAIKTIGDAYMAAAGLPIECPDHAQRTARFALDVLDAITDFNADHNTQLSVRIGFHSGPVVAGVTGTRKFTFDVWGDAVNVASRMESNGAPGRINVSQASYELLRDEYAFEPRGEVYVKGKGNMPCYFLLGPLRAPNSDAAGGGDAAGDGDGDAAAAAATAAPAEQPTDAVPTGPLWDRI